MLQLNNYTHIIYDYAFDGSLFSLAIKICYIFVLQYLYMYLYAFLLKRGFEINFK